jgi:hypothetical protein
MNAYRLAAVIFATFCASLALSQTANQAIPNITSGGVTTALGYTPANKAGDTFTGAVTVNGNFQISGPSSGAEVIYYVATSGVDLKYWDSVAAGSALAYRAINDAFNGATTWLLVTRSGYTVTTVEFPTGTVKTTNGLITPSVTISGSAPTATGTCPIKTQVGGNTAGSFLSNGVCAGGTIILTFATTAPNDWVCQAWDLTTPANTIKQSNASASATTATFTATMANNDLARFQCTAF